MGKFKIALVMLESGASIDVRFKDYPDRNSWMKGGWSVLYAAKQALKTAQGELNKLSLTTPVRSAAQQLENANKIVPILEAKGAKMSKLEEDYLVGKIP